MIYCNIKGGLGNMLFQIAATISMSIDKKTECSFPNLKEYINFLNLENFHNENLNYAHEYLKLFEHLNTKKINKNIKTFEFPFHFDKIEIEDNCIIDGYFQSEKYFIHNRFFIIDNIFCNKQEIIDRNKEKYKEILNKKTTSIHVRRGDYLKFPSIHPCQGVGYYLKSIDVLKDYTDVFVVFSDDIEWCKKNLESDKEMFFVENDRDYNEIILMSMCDNNIISNSSFSWWGAWLNENKNKKVIGPKIWFGNQKKLEDKDIIPENWIKI